MAVLIILIVLTSFVFSVSDAQQRNSTIIRLGSSLTPTSNNTYWSSESGLFAFGFYQERNGYAIGIWLPKIQQKTVVWTANRDDPLLSSDARLVLSSDGRLVLQRNQSPEQRIAETSEQLASSASMLDSGNFVLYNREMEIIWQTFDHPTDTILSTQRLSTANRLVSSKSDTDHSSGRFQIVMQVDGNLIQFPVAVGLTERSERSYWNSKTYDPAGNSTSLNLDSSGWLYLQNSSGLVKTIKGGENASDSVIYRTTIDVDGIFRLYSHNLTENGDWSILWLTSSNRCEPKGSCGLNGYCTFAGQSEEPECACPPGFVFIDTAQRSLGCQKNSTVDSCLRSNAIASTIERLNDVQWDDNPYSNSAMSLDKCQEDCARDCNCQVALHVNQQYCRKQLLPLRLGRNITGLSQNVVTQTQEMTTLIKVLNGVPGVKTGGEKRKNKLQTGILITVIALSSISCLLLGILSIFVCKYRVWKNKKTASLGNNQLLEDVILQSYTYDELKRATNNFTNQIGKGAFGTVFKGVISNGNRVVAVKRLEIVVEKGEREFHNEMKIIARTHHKNLVRLLGYCHEGISRLLVYEFMSNGSLADFLFKSERKPVWEDRIKIAVNVARGILYLHDECAPQIIHCDIKPENILMDDKQCAKIADFGLSKLLMSDQSKTSTGLRGTIGYVAPEWIKHSPITVKADVYSFGVMLLEIMRCQRRPDVDFVYDCFEAGELNSLFQNEEVETSKLDRLVRVGLWCIQDEPASRPLMKDVVLMLEGTIDIPVPPRPFSFGSFSETSV